MRGGGGFGVVTLKGNGNLCSTVVMLFLKAVLLAYSSSISVLFIVTQ